MRRPTLTIVLAAFALAGALTACFSPLEPACAFSCGPDQACPESYACMADGLCHRVGSQAPCMSPGADAGAD